MKDAFTSTNVLDALDIFGGSILDDSAVAALEHAGLRCGRCCLDPNMATTWRPDPGRSGIVICNRCVAADRSVVPFESPRELAAQSTPNRKERKA